MQKLYRLKDLEASTGIHRQTISTWVENGWLVPCDRDGGRSVFFTQAEHDRLMSAIAEAAGSNRRVHLNLIRTMHTARKLHAIDVRELADRCSCCISTARKALFSLGQSAEYDVAVLEEDVSEVKAAVDRVRKMAHKSRAEGRRKAKALRKEATVGITVHLKGLTISLTREDANALAEELISQL